MLWVYKNSTTYFGDSRLHWNPADVHQIEFYMFIEVFTTPIQQRYFLSTYNGVGTVLNALYTLLNSSSWQIYDIPNWAQRIVDDGLWKNLTHSLTLDWFSFQYTEVDKEIAATRRCAKHFAYIIPFSHHTDHGRENLIYPYFTDGETEVQGG